MVVLPLQGIKIIDFTWVGAGPYSTKILADAGAEVIKIESGLRPDILRLTAPFKDGIKGINRSGYFSNRNTSKKSVMLDMSKEKSRELIKEMVKSSDVVANSFTPGTLDKWGLSYEELKKINEKIIYLSMPMQGTTGPHKNYSGFGAMMNALIGLNHLSGLPDKEPIGTGTNYPDHIPNPAHASFALMAALRFRNRTGKGQYVELAQTESALSVLAIAIMEAANNAISPIRNGNKVPYAVPNNAYPCKGNDRWCVISCTNDSEWENLINTLNIKELKNDERFNTFKRRKMHEDELDVILAKNTIKYEAEEIMHLLQKQQVPAGVVQNAQDLIERDPQLAYSGHFVKLPHAEMIESIYNNAPYKLSETPIQVKKAAPLLGEHNEQVLKDIYKLTDEEYKRLEDEGLFQ